MWEKKRFCPIPILVNFAFLGELVNLELLWLHGFGVKLWVRSRFDWRLVVVSGKDGVDRGLGWVGKSRGAVSS